MSYTQAMEELLAIKKRIQSEEIDLDKLAEQVSRAKELISFCEKKLRKTEEQLQDLFKKDES